MDYSERIEEFETLCHMYKTIKKDIEAQKNKELDPLSRMTLKIYQEQVDFVDMKFEEIKRNFGTHTAMLLWKLLVEEDTRDNISAKYKVPKKTLNVWIDDSLHEMFDTRS